MNLSKGVKLCLHNALSTLLILTTFAILTMQYTSYLKARKKRLGQQSYLKQDFENVASPCLQIQVKHYKVVILKLSCRFLSAFLDYESP